MSSQDESNQPGLFDKEEADQFRVSNSHAMGNYQFEKKTIVRKGKKVEVANFSLNASKISDGSISILQRDYHGRYSYPELKKKARDNLQDFFEEYELEKTEGLSANAIKRNKDIMEAKIEREIKSIIRADIADSCVVKVPFDTFMSELQVDSFYRGEDRERLRFNHAVQSVLDAQSNSWCTYAIDEVQWSDKLGRLEIVSRAGKTALLPTVEFVIHEEGGMKTIEDLLTSKKRNKAKYIKYVELRFDPVSFSELVAPGVDYTIGDRRIRRKFSNKFSHQIDLMLRSLERIQRYKDVNRFTFEQLKKKFPTNYKRYIDFKNNVLIPALDDFNQSPDLRAELDEHYKKQSDLGELDYLRFKIARINDKGLPVIDTFDLPTYIAVQHFYFDTFIEKKLTDFQDHYTDLAYYTNDIEKYRDITYCDECKNDKSLGEWEAEYYEAVAAYEELSGYVKNNPEWFEERDIRLCDKILCLVNNETGLPFAAFGGQFILDNPIKSLAFYKGKS